MRIFDKNPTVCTTVVKKRERVKRLNKKKAQLQREVNLELLRATVLNNPDSDSDGILDASP